MRKDESRMKRQVIWIIAWAILLPYLSAQQVVMPEKIAAFGPIEVQKPVLLDSVNLKNSTFSDETLLSYSITFPEQNRFTTELLADTAEFFHVNKPERGMAFYLFSIYLTGDRYGKGQLTVTSPNPWKFGSTGQRKKARHNGRIAYTWLAKSPLTWRDLPTASGW